MRKLFIVFLLMISSMSFAQNNNISLLGKWGKGACHTVHRWEGYTLIGNGAYLEVYKKFGSTYMLKDRLLMDGPVEAIWTETEPPPNKHANVVVACGFAGLHIVYLDYQFAEFTHIASLELPGYLNGIHAHDSNPDTLYISAGYEGFHIIEFVRASQPHYISSFQLPYFVNDVHAVSDTILLAAVGKQGVYSLNTSDRLAPDSLDHIKFYGFLTPEITSIASNDSVAFLAAEIGGLRLVDYRDPEHLSIYPSLWAGGQDAVVKDVFVDADYAYVAAGEAGFFVRIDITDPNNVGLEERSYNTAGTASEIVVDADTVYIADMSNGFLSYDLNLFHPVDSVATADHTYDVALFNNQAFLATGRQGIYQVDITNPGDLLNEIRHVDTEGEALSVDISDPFVFAATGSDGMAVWEINNPASGGSYTFSGDTCYDVCVPPGGYAYLACGESGIVVVDYTTLESISRVNTINTQGEVTDIEYANNKIYVADSQAVYIYDIMGSNLEALDSLTSDDTDMQASAIQIQGDTVVVANGEFGFTIWDTESGDVETFETTGICKDVRISGQTVYTAESGYGLYVYDISDPSGLLEIGNWPTNGHANGIDMLDDKIVLADIEDGLYLFESNIKPEITLSPHRFNFGPVPSSYSRSILMTVENTGTAVLDVSNINIASNPTFFSFTPRTFSVPPGESQIVEIKFIANSTSVGDISTTAKVHSNDPDSSDITIYLEGKVSSQVVEEPYSNDVFTLGLWEFDELVSDYSLRDESNFDHTGYISQSVQRSGLSPFDNGTSLFFSNDAADKGILPNASHLDMDYDEFTIEFWFRMEEKPQDYYILMQKGYNTTRQYQFALGADTRTRKGLSVEVYDVNNTPVNLETGSMEDLFTDHWYHTALTLQDDTLKLWLNGQVYDSIVMQSTLRSETTDSLILGTNANEDWPYHGQIDELRISNVARQPWEFNVNRSSLTTYSSSIDFGYVQLNQKREVPFKIGNDGDHLLTVSNINISPELDLIDFTFGGEFTISADEDTTLWFAYSPDAVSVLDGNYNLVIESSDPNQPTMQIPINGQGITTMPAGAYLNDAFTLGLWHCDQSGTDLLNDASDNDLDGVLKQGAFFDNSERQFSAGASIKFNGISSVCEIPPRQVPQIGANWGGFTAECWFRPGNIISPTRSILLRAENDETVQFELSLRQSQLEGKLYNTTGDSFVVASPQNLIETLQWYHAAISLKEDTLTLYLNGEPQGIRLFNGYLAATDREGMPEDSVTFYMGNDGSNLFPFFGHIDEIRLSGIGRQRWEFNVNLARIALNTSSVSFGNMLINKTRSKTIVASNPGIATLDVDSIYLSIGDAFELDINEFDLEPNFTQDILVTFNPMTAAVYRDTINVLSNDPYWQDKLMQIPLHGIGIANRLIGQYSPDPYTMALYHLNDGSGLLGTDTSSFQNHITLMNESIWSDTVKYGSHSVAMNRGWLYLADNPLENGSTSQFTSEFWFYPHQEPAANSILMHLGPADTTDFVEITWHASQGLQAKVYNSDGDSFHLQQSTEDTINLNAWNHLAFSNDNSYLKFYLNKSCMDSVAWTGDFTSDGYMSFGADSAGHSPFNGNLDEIRISDVGRQRWELNVSAPSILVNTDPIRLNKILVGFKSERSLHVRNNGDQRLNIRVQLKENGVFTLSDSAFALPLENGQLGKDITIHFEPEVAGTFYDTLVFYTNDKNMTSFEIPVSGLAISHIISGEPIIDSLTVSYYNFNTDVGNIITNGTGSSFNAYLMNGAAWTANGVFQGGLKLDGENDFVSVEVPDGLENDFTFEFYFKTDTSAQSLFGKTFEDTLIDPFEIFINTSGQIQTLNVGDNSITGPFVSDNIWHHLALTYEVSDDTAKIFVDGLLVAALFWDIDFSFSDNYLFSIGQSTDPQNFSYFDGYIDEFQISKHAREIWNYLWISQTYDVRVRQITPHSPLTGQDMSLSINVPVTLNIDTLTLYYRKGGEQNYQSILGTPSGDSTYQVTILADHVGLTGLEYYFELVNDSGFVFTIPLLDAASHPYTQSIHGKTIEAELDYHIQYFNDATVRYQYITLFSVPFIVKDPDPVHVMGDEFGPYDPYSWRYFWWRTLSGEYIEYNPSFAIFDFAPGRAYWLIRHNDKPFVIDSLQTVSTDANYTISLLADTLDLVPGWNMIGNPFNFPVRWDDCIVTSDSVSGLYGFDGTDGFESQISVMEPWKGYFIANQDDQPAQVIIPPKKAVTLSKPLQKTAENEHQEGEWYIAFDLTSKYSNDLDNQVGVKQSARAIWDPSDQPSPPHPGSSVQFSIVHPDWKNHKGNYTSDFQAPGKEGYIWNIHVTSDFSNLECQIKWQFNHEIPETWQAYLFDLEKGIAYNMLELNTIQIKTDGKTPDLKQYKCIVGTEEFIQKNKADIALKPIAFSLSQNYPNPFNLTTEIKYSLPQNTDVELNVYNAIGQKVKTLVNQRQNAGYHQVQWNGTNESGNVVASGVYIMRLKTNDRSAVKKMIILK